jgi:hypothetical protein
LRQIREITLDRLAFVLFLSSPFFLFGAVHLVIMSESWLQTGAVPSIVVNAKRVFFWVLLVTYLIVMVAFVGRFGVQVW